MLYYLWLTGERMNKSEKEQPVMGAKNKKMASLEAGSAQPKNKFLPEGRNAWVNQAIEFG